MISVRIPARKKLKTAVKIVNEVFMLSEQNVKVTMGQTEQT